MNEMIFIYLQPTDATHTVYIMSNNSEIVPIIKKATIDELPSVVSMSAAKYNITHIKLVGPHDYTKGIRNTLTEKINTCFGKENNFLIELV